MPTAIEITQKQWDWLNGQLEEARDMATRCRESDLTDMAETYDEKADQIERDMRQLENWLMDAGAPGWVAS